jgi:hypothetical protein
VRGHRDVGTALVYTQIGCGSENRGCREDSPCRAVHVSVAGAAAQQQATELLQGAPLYFDDSHFPYDIQETRNLW